jgi:hypothetical protein
VFFEKPHLALPVISSILCVLLPVAALAAFHSTNTNRALCTGWMPLLIALSISSLSGFVFARSERLFQFIAIFQPILNGTGSNLIAVQVSRISTYLHQRSERRLLPIEQIGSSLKTVRSEPHLFTVDGSITVNPAIRSITRKEWLKHCALRPHLAFVGSSKCLPDALLQLQG